MTDSATKARNLMRAHDWASLATNMTGDNHPYASLVLVAADYDASPILLISGLAEHARNIAADDRISLLFDGTRGLPSALTGARVSVQGRAQRSDAAHIRLRFLARHEDAAEYADFGDFNFYRIAVERGHLVAGFGQIAWIGRDELLHPAAKPDAMSAWEADAVKHMNEDHCDAIQRYALYLSGAEGDGWVMTGCDPEGCDLRQAGEVLRLGFAEAANDPDSLRRQFVALARSAEAKTI